MKKITSVFLRISVTLALLIFLFFKTDFRSLYEVLKSSDWFLMLLSLLAFFLLNVVCLLRWRILLSGSDIHLPFGRIFLSYFSSQFFNLVLPSTIGGDAVRTLDIAKYANKHSSNILATVILDRVAGFFGLMTILIFSLGFGFKLLRDEGILIVALLLLLMIIFLAATIFSRRFAKWICYFIPFEKWKAYVKQMQSVTLSYRQKKGILCAAWLFSLLIQAGMSFVYYMVAHAIHAPISLIYFLIAVPVISSIAAIPISLGGLGLRDSASVVILGKFGLPAEKALALSLSNFGFIFILGMLGALCYVSILCYRRL